MTSLGAENVRYEAPTDEITTVGFRRAAGVEAVPIPPKVQQAPPAHDSPAEAFGRHFIRCFFCRIGDRYTEDHFCEAGRDLLIAVLDEYAEPAFASRACRHNQRWEHWIPALRRIESGKLVCGSEKDRLLYPNYRCPCDADCECRRPR